jgi:hypothetical protein
MARQGKVDGNTVIDGQVAVWEDDSDAVLK